MTELHIQETRKITISDEQEKKIALEFIKKKYNIDILMWIEDGKLMQSVEYHTSHAWSCDEEVREATELDKCILKVVKDIWENK